MPVVKKKGCYCKNCYSFEGCFYTIELDKRWYALPCYMRWFNDFLVNGQAYVDYWQIEFTFERPMWGV